MLIPYSTEVLITRLPLGNFIIIGLCLLSFVLAIAGVFPDAVVESMVLQGWSPLGLVGYLFLHAGLAHLVFNMLYLWVFGNAVCEKIGNRAFLAVFLMVGVLAAAIHNIMSGEPAIGASGAINGIIGFYLVLYPVNRVNCFYWFFRPGTIQCTGFWLILFWFAVDAWHAFAGTSTGIAYWAHIGGTVSGLALGIVFIKGGWAPMAEYDNPTLLDYIGGKGGYVPSERWRPAVRPAARELAASMVRRELPHVMPRTPPAPAAPRQDVNIDCPHCAQNLDVPSVMIGRSFACPTCRGEITLEEE